MHGTQSKLGLTCKKVNARHGTFTYYDQDELVGFSLGIYGEYSEAEVEVFRKVLRPGDTAIDVGANIGAFTLPMARLVGPTGKVISYEASEANVDLLAHNVKENGFSKTVEVIAGAASADFGLLQVSRQDAMHAYSTPEINSGRFEIPCSPIDALELQKLKLLKIDVDRHELQVLQGARETIKRCRPIIYIENESDDLREALVAELVELGYRLYWHKPFHFNPDNFFKEKRNLFGNLISLMNVCVPDEEGYEVLRLEEVSDYRSDDLMFDRERDRYQKRVDKDPSDLTSRLMVAHHENLMQRSDRALALIDENLKRDPTHGPTLAIQGLLALQRGEWKKGWPAYELRFCQPNRHQFGGDRHFDCPKWDGQPTGEPVLIWTEQGFGDNIMFVRLMKEVFKRAPNAFLECRPELYELFEQSSISPQRLFWLYRMGRTLPPYSYHCSVPSLAAALGADEEMIKIDGPYLFADPLLVKNWQGIGNVRIAQTPDPLVGAKIGLCYKGSSASERPYTRNIPGGMFAKMIVKHGPFFPILAFESFAMTAAAIMALDLVITVDTSVAHLAGALGKETWLLLSYDPDFRWGLKGDRTIWYPTIRIFRQPKFRDWQSVIDEVSVVLEARNAVARVQERKNEDIEDWATNLSNDLSKHGD